ncbi:SDR family NAD(P)-dependent oxidoreductase [Micromonospora sp. DT81.3]|uniref:SDR family NAD(P)-dependent oxidoreductase n=1 Tax=Actinomycetes TaxID=1760 RepID=UPI003CE755A6
MTPLDTTGVDLSGLVAIVTGGGRGLGRGMALALSAAGAKVAVVARTKGQLGETVRLIETAGGRVLAVPADVTDHSAVETMVATVHRELGEIGLLVNNAGVTGKPGPIWDSDPEDWQHTVDVNLNGTYLCSTAVGRLMLEQGAGRIVNVASGAALGPILNGSGYATSKAAVLRLTECLAADGRAHGIKAFAIDPGSVRTAMTEYLIESDEGRTYIPGYRDYILAGGDVPAELSANLVTLIASGKLDSMSGRLIRVTDDVEQMALRAEQITEDDLYTLRLRTL